MAEIVPFRAVRPKSRFAGAVVAPPYDAVSDREAEIIIHKNPLSFLRVLKPEATIPFFSRKGEIIYEEAKKELLDFLRKDIFIRENTPSFYLYSEKDGSHIQNGLVGLFSCRDFSKGIISGSEKTRKFELYGRVKWIKSTHVQAGPVFLFYEEKSALSKIVQSILSEPPLYDFETEDNVRHTVRRISKGPKIEEIIKEFAKIERLYVADGNHRTHAACFVNKNRGYFLGAAVPHTELRFFSYDRVIKKNVSISKILNALSNFFDIKKTKTVFRPFEKGMLLFISKNEDFILKAKSKFVHKPDITVLDNAVISENGVISESEIEYVSGKVSPASIKRAVQNGRFAAAILLSPPQISEIVSAANSKNLLPPKSVWFDPKFRSGLFLNPLDSNFNLKELSERTEDEFGVWE